ncbi:MAG: hypothetical protein AYK19_05620 [Theionarchaea archaeon DG-70-1]|nr:MAG: hypothetical protein AYK19_05620 [Theionarchaea archaeon DG-70-1]
MKKSAHTPKADYPFYAFVTLLGIAVWGSIALYTHMVTPSGATRQEITFLGTIVVMVWILVPLYWLRVPWGYIAGMIVNASGFLGAVGASALLHRLHFTWSLYTVSVVILYTGILVHLYTSYKSYENLPPVQRKKAVCSVSGIILLMVVTGGVFSHYSGLIYWKYMYNATLYNIDEELQTMSLDEKIQYVMAKGTLPTLVAGIVVNNKLVWVKAYGDARVNTMYAIGSVSKPVTATAVLQLYEKGLLDLDDDINEYLPFNVRHPHYPDIPVTIRMLLQHQSGLGRNIEQHEMYMNGRLLGEWAAENFGLQYPEYDYPSLGTFLEGLLTPDGAYYSSDVWATSAPGTGYTYSNAGYDLLGYIVEQVTCNPYPDYLKDHIFDPLNMTQTGVHATDCGPDNAIPHERVYALLSKTNVELPVYDRAYTGAGGIRTTVPDLAQFLIAHMNHGQHPNGYQLLTPESVELMHEQAVYVFNRFSMVGYGMGWKHQSTDPDQYFYLHGSQGHDGGTEGYTCHMWMVETETGSYGIIVMTNVYHYYKQDPLWMITWSNVLQDVLFHEASVMLAKSSQ